MYNYSLNLKNQKKKKIQLLKQQYTYLYICQYINNPVINDRLLKNVFKSTGVNYIYLKKKLFSINLTLKNQGAISVIYFNDINKLLYINKQLQKINILKPICLWSSQIIIPAIKLNKMFKSSTCLYSQLMNPIYSLYTILRRI